LCHVIIPETKLGDAATLQPRAASLVARLLRLFAVLATIEFYR
jgi:hypothetical protein